MILLSFAKINLGLQIGNKRADGFHDVDMVVQSIDLCDSVILHRSFFRRINVFCNKNICKPEENLAYISAKIMFEKYNFDFGLDIHIHKNIPIGAGLGGGSSNAAAVIIGLSKILSLSNREVLNIASEVGADVPFCCFGGTCRCTGKGEVLRRVRNLENCKILIKNNENPSFTKNAYEKLDAFFENNNIFNNGDGRIENLIDSLQCSGVNRVSNCCFNDFENIIEVPEKWHLTGSGSSYFKIVGEDFTDYDNNIIICRPINFGVKIIEDNWN